MRFQTNYLFMGLILLAVSGCKNQKPMVMETNDDRIDVVFYNVENLFDLEDHPEKNDDEFTPESKKQWTKERYDDKLEALAKVLSSTSDELPDVIGLCEVENRKVVEELVSTGELAKGNFEILHRESPDGRGIDVALAYNPAKISFEEVRYIRTRLPAGDRPNTRLVQYTKGITDGDTLHVFVNHWPSRYGGKEKSEPNRMTVAKNVKLVLDSIRTQSPNAKIILMGDFNDTPIDNSLRRVLYADKEGTYGLQNLMWLKQKNGIGTYNYKGSWDCLDQFIVSSSLVEGNGLNTSADKITIVKHDWMLYINDKGEAYPSRTYGGPNYYGGFSDHLPIHMVIERGR